MGHSRQTKAATLCYCLAWWHVTSVTAVVVNKTTKGADLLLLVSSPFSGTSCALTTIMPSRNNGGGPRGPSPRQAGLQEQMRRHFASEGPWQEAREGEVSYYDICVVIYTPLQ